MLIYNQKLKPRARELRKNQTHAEELLWKRIKGKQVNGYQFLRQRPVANFIVDFLCLKLRLVIEIDGPIHIQNKGVDTFRQEQLELLGFMILRFSNEEIEENIDSVVEVISKYTKKSNP